VVGWSIDDHSDSPGGDIDYRMISRSDALKRGIIEL
jgi:hypothetical protein